MKTIHIDVGDAKSIRDAIADLKEARAEWLRKANLLCETVAAMLADMIAENLSQIPFSDDLKDISTHQATPRIPIYASYAKGNSVIVEENGGEIAFIEFGAGIYHNSSGRNNPLAEKVSFDTGIGSYGKGQGNNKYWFVAHNLISCGTPAYMPIYNAIEAIKPQIPTIARQVFV